MTKKVKKEVYVSKERVTITLDKGILIFIDKEQKSTGFKRSQFIEKILSTIFCSKKQYLRFQLVKAKMDYDAILAKVERYNITDETESLMAYLTGK